jgi:hypothetical protein
MTRLGRAQLVGWVVVATLIVLAVYILVLADPRLTRGLFGAALASLAVPAAAALAIYFAVDRRSGGDPARGATWGLVLSLLALVGEAMAALLLLSPVPSNSSLWVPINIGYFLGVPLAIVGATLSAYALLLGAGPRAVAGLVLGGAALILFVLAPYR